MSITYDIDTTRKLVTLKYTGQITVAEKMALHNQILIDPRFEKGMNTLCDITDGKFNWDLKDIDALRHFVLDIQDRAGNSKWAVIYDESNKDFTARIFKVLHDAYDSVIEIQMFYSEADALKWLKEAASTIKTDSQ